ncbi:protein-S-isoprenylcysteine O-methyltransferase A-like isoform X1 [Primulina huaijiensis]
MLMHIYDDIEPLIPSLVSYFSSMISDTIFFTMCRQLLQMVLAIIFFHCSEYILAIFFHGKNNVTLKSLLISKNYVLAMVFSLIEYLVEIYFFPELKERWLLSNIGLAMVVFGEIIRKLAIITAGRSFTHLIKIHHEEHHVLIRHGVYRYLRHPSYCGFLIWSVGTQIMVCNPLSTLAFACVVWRFFQQRIPYEEFFLRQFFGLEYEEYTDQTFSGIPFIK